MPRALQVALIGQRFMGRAHSNAWSQVAKFFDVELQPALHTVAARDVEGLEPFARRWGWKHASDDWAALASNPEIELVDIGTPNHMHREQAVAMLAAGKHVACEKPLAGTLEDARVMLAAATRAAKKGVRTFVWFNYRRCPAVALAYRLVREGVLGEIYHVRARYLQSWGGPQTPMSWRFQRRYAGSGAHGDLNAHSVDLARFLVGDELSEIHGAVARTFVTERAMPGARGKLGNSDVDDCVLFNASFSSGATASFEASRLAHGHQNDNAIEINGSKGSLRFAFEDMNVLELCEVRDPRTDGWRRIMCTSAGHHPYAAAWWPDAHVIGYEHGFTNMAADICRVLGGAEPEVPLPDFFDAYQTQRVLAAALDSARERRAIKLSQVK